MKSTFFQVFIAILAAAGVLFAVSQCREQMAADKKLFDDIQKMSNTYR